MCRYRYLLNLLLLVLLGGSVLPAYSAADPLLKGRVSESVGATRYPRVPGSLVPSIAGPALVGAGGKLVGTMSMQGLPKGTIVMPTALGPALIGPRGEFKGSLESFGSGLASPAIGMGPAINYNARPELARIRSMFQPTPFPLSQAVTAMPAGEAGVSGPQAGTVVAPGMREYAAARVVPHM